MSPKVCIPPIALATDRAHVGSLASVNGFVVFSLGGVRELTIAVTASVSTCDCVLIVKLINRMRSRIQRVAREQT